MFCVHLCGVRIPDFHKLLKEGHAFVIGTSPPDLENLTLFHSILQENSLSAAASDLSLQFMAAVGPERHS